MVERRQGVQADLDRRPVAMGRIARARIGTPRGQGDRQRARHDGVELAMVKDFEALAGLGARGVSRWPRIDGGPTRALLGRQPSRPCPIR